MTDEPRSPCAERHANAKLSRASGAAGKEQVCHVGAHDQQHEPDGDDHTESAGEPVGAENGRQS